MAEESKHSTDLPRSRTLDRREFISGAGSRRFFFLNYEARTGARVAG